MKLGEYELIERIAVGGMAEVYRARAAGAEGFEKPVAVKRVLPHLASDPRFVTMLLGEARIHAWLSHRNIVQIHDLGVSEEGEYFIVLEYLEGRDLRSLLDALGALGERVPDALALHVASELAQGLHFAHELRDAAGVPLGLVHRDVSPSNVLVSYAGEVKLSDFGLAKRRADNSVAGALKGRLEYMSPEQARRAPLDRRTDVFSLGALLFEMLTGRRLRDITNEADGWREVAAGAARSARGVRPDLPGALDRLLDRALAPDPSGRFADAAAFGAAIREICAHMSTIAGPADLQGLLQQVLPPGSPRVGSEQPSQVIRLISEMRPPPPPSELAPPRPPMPQAARLPLPPVVPPDAPERRPRRTKRTLVVLRGAGAWGTARAVIGGLAVVAMAAVAVHFRIVPLDVLAVWRKPTSLMVTSRPEGGQVTLDGARLPGRTPTFVSVNRDRQDHVVEVTRPGFRPGRLTIRYDRETTLRVVVPLTGHTPPAIQAIPRTTHGAAIRVSGR